MTTDDEPLYYYTEDDQRTLKIRALNDRLRTQRKGGYFRVTPGIFALGHENFADIKKCLAAFDDFHVANDMYGEHDFGKMVVNGREIIWKIDYLDKAMDYHSPDPSDPGVTLRYLTVMLPEEY